MKKLFSLVIGLMFVSVLMAQSTSPRFGITKAQDNTGRNLTYALTSVTDATGNDSIVLKPNAFQTIVNITAKDSITLGSPKITNSYLGDVIIIIITAPSGTPKVKFSSYLNVWKTSGTATLSTGLTGTIKLIFNGTKWVETGRQLY